MRVGLTPNKQMDWDTIPNHKEVLCDLYTSGMSLNKMAMKFNTSSQNIKNKLISFGIELRR